MTTYHDREDEKRVIERWVLREVRNRTVPQLVDPEADGSDGKEQSKLEEHGVDQEELWPHQSRPGLRR